MSEVVEIESPGEILVIEAGGAQTQIIIEAAGEVEVLEVAEQGPPGPPGGDLMPYAKRTDFVGDDVIYKGEARPGTLDAEPAWRISRITLVGDDAAEQWAGGTAEFVHAWSAREGYAYL